MPKDVMNILLHLYEKPLVGESYKSHMNIIK